MKWRHGRPRPCSSLLYDDTIAAIATAPGAAALSVVRMSGPDALSIGAAVFSGRLRDRRLVLGRLKEPTTGKPLDQAMGAYLAPPNTYTREPVVEFTCHGGAVPTQAALEALLAAGARLARPGEFTLRAFLNGRIDLAEAEAVLDVIQARTHTGMQVAINALDGRLSRQIKELRAGLLGPLAYLTALVDFPEDEVGHEDFVPALLSTLARLEALAAGGEQGMLYRQGVRVAIVGRPNVGKSSLLNRLLGTDRSIVTQVPGTTRDTVEEVAVIRGIPFLLVDTAGIRDSADPVERLGVERSLQAMEAADLVILVIDGSEPLDGRDQAIASALQAKTVLVAVNKRDLIPRTSYLIPWPWPHAYVSALHGHGMEELEQHMATLVMRGQAVPAEEALVSNPRHQAAIKRAAAHVQEGLESYRNAMPVDCVTIDLTAAINALGEITGENVGEDLLDLIFSRFCIGK